MTLHNYSEFTSRNSGYISAELQGKLREMSLLIAGCGVGSVFAEVAVRLGCENITLIDGDLVNVHNLNRQDYVSSDVSRYKVEALAERLRAINPVAKIDPKCIYIDSTNVEAIVASSEIIFDTIDFADLAAVISLHDEAARQGKPVFSGMNIGWGAGLVYFPEGGECTYRDLFELPKSGSVEGYSYTQQFELFVKKASHILPADVKEAVRTGLKQMEDGSPCPMAQVAPGAYCLAGLAGTALVRYLAGLPVSAAPDIIYSDMSNLCATTTFSFEM